MKLLLDENLPKRLKKDFTQHRVFTIREMGWSGISNGMLLQLMIENKFDILITFDKNLQHQQNFKKYTLTVLVLIAADNSYNTLKDFIPKINQTISSQLNSGPMELHL